MRLGNEIHVLWNTNLLIMRQVRFGTSKAPSHRLPRHPHKRFTESECSERDPTVGHGNGHADCPTTRHGARYCSRQPARLFSESRRDPISTDVGGAGALGGDIADVVAGNWHSRLACEFAPAERRARTQTPSA